MERHRTRPRRHEWSRRKAGDPSEETRVVMEIGAGPVQGETSGQGDQGAHGEAKGPVQGDRSGQGIYGTIIEH